MGIKVSSIVLKDVEVIELENGEFEKRFVNPKKYPAFITNRSLATGRNLGITKSSLITEIVRMNSTLKQDKDGNIDMDNLTPEQADELDTHKYLPVIYLGIIGANKNLELSYDDFLDKYHGDIEKTLNDYMDLVVPYLAENATESDFRKGLAKSTEKK